MDFHDVGVITMYCPNCGHKVMGYKDKDGVIKIVCNRCKCFIVSKYHKKATNIKVVASQN
ncbi:MAG: hypothetical protein IJB10_02965 [Clostridia bacterium]|nr:hypothetical protein [Clostridia bacterium]